MLLPGCGEALGTKADGDADAAALLGLIRPFALRLSDDQPPLPCPMADSAPTLHCDTTPEARGRAADHARRRTEEAPSASQSPFATLRAAVLADLVLAPDQPTVLDRSIRVLSTRDEDGGDSIEDPTLLATAYALRAEATFDPLDRLRALEHVLRAFERAPTSPAALFNRALLLGDFGLVREAVAAWHDFLAVETDDRWAAEGRGRLADLEADTPLPVLGGSDSAARLVAADAQRAREVAADSLLPRWGALVLRNDDTDADAPLALVRALGAAILEATGEPTIADVVADIDDAHDPARLRVLAGAFVHYGHARSLFAAGDIESSARLFRAAAAAFVESGSTFALLPRMHDAIASLYAGDPRPLQRLGAAVDSLPQHSAVRGLYLRATALRDARAGHYAPALRQYEHARAIFQAIREADHHAAAGFGIGEALVLAGQTQRGLDELLGVLGSPAARRPGITLQNVLHATGTEASLLGLPAVAQAVHAEGVRVADSTGRAFDLPEALLRLARTQQRIGDGRAAAATLARAASAVAALSDSILRPRLAAEADEVRALVLLESEPRRALAAATSAVDYFHDRLIRPRLIDALTTRADVRLALGDAPGAMADLQAGLAAFEVALVGAPPLARAALVDDAAAAADRLVTLLLDHGMPDSALAVVDHVRTLSVATRAPAHARREKRAASWRPDTAEAVLVFAHLRDRIALWTWTAEERKHAADIEVAPVVAAVDRLLSALAADDRTRAEDLLAELHELLVQPADLSARIRRVTIVSDGALHRVPFAALRSNGRPLVERIVVRSVAMLARAAAPWDGAPPGTPRALLVGVATARPALPPLAAIGGEIDGLAALYGAGTLRLTDRAATPGAFLRALPRHDVVHFAGHAIGNGARPYTAELVLTPDAQHDGAVRVLDLAPLDLSGVRLVVLAACSTADAGLGARTDTFDSLAGAFVAAGVDAVVGSLWPVDDARTSDLLVDFHRRILEGYGPADALALAQRARIGEPGSLATWAAFRVRQ